MAKQIDATPKAMAQHLFGETVNGFMGLINGAKAKAGETAAIIKLQQRFNNVVFDVGKEVAEQIVNCKTPPYDVSPEKIMEVKEVFGEIHRLKNK